MNNNKYPDPLFSCSWRLDKATKTNKGNNDRWNYAMPPKNKEKEEKELKIENK